VGNNDLIIETKNIRKTFPGVTALDNVNFKLKKGEIHALIGENGAGKSTFIKILMGVHKMDKGDIFFEGDKVNIKNPLEADKIGLAAVYQHMITAPLLTVAENIFLGRQPKKNGLIDWKKMNQDAKEILEDLNMDINPKVRLNKLSNVQRRMVVIAKAISKDAKVIIFDEPTAQLAEEETEELHDKIKMLKEKGISIIYISHHLEEVFEICDRVSVLRDGEHVGTEKVDDITEDDLIAMMVGRDVGELYYKEDIKKGKELLRVENLERDSELSDVSFSLHEGEVLGVYGLLGAGRTELVRSLFGAEPITGGKIIIEGEEVKIDNPSQAINNNIGLLPEDRHEEGVALLQSVNDNCNVVSSKFSARYGVLNKKVERETTRKNIEDLNIKTPSINQLVKNLSGGNQQKVVIAKWINANSNILLFDEPTVGIDVGAKKEIYVLMSELLKEGKGIIFVSSYIPELMEICDRIMVLSRGKMTGIVEKEDFDQEELLYLATRE